MKGYSRSRNGLVTGPFGDEEGSGYFQEKDVISQLDQELCRELDARKTLGYDSSERGTPKIRFPYSHFQEADYHPIGQISKMSKMVPGGSPYKVKIDVPKAIPTDSLSLVYSLAEPQSDSPVKWGGLQLLSKTGKDAPEKEENEEQEKLRSKTSLLPVMVEEPLRFNNREGFQVPSTVFTWEEDYGWDELTSTRVFKNKKCLVFSARGPTSDSCTTYHVPRYNDLTPVLKRNCDIDTVCCLVVGSPSALKEWQASMGAHNIIVLADKDMEFTTGMGMLTDYGTEKEEEVGSWRYAMIVDDLIITKMFIENHEDLSKDPREVTTADAMMQCLNPDAKEPKFVTLLVKNGCPDCAKLQVFLDAREVVYTVHRVGVGEEFSRSCFLALAGKEDLPQMFVDGQRIGGPNEAQEWVKEHLSVTDFKFVHWGGVSR